MEQGTGILNFSWKKTFCKQISRAQVKMAAGDTITNPNVKNEQKWIIGVSFFLHFFSCLIRFDLWRFVYLLSGNIHWSIFYCLANAINNKSLALTTHRHSLHLGITANWKIYLSRKCISTWRYLFTFQLVSSFSSSIFVAKKVLEPKERFIPVDFFSPNILEVFNYY